MTLSENAILIEELKGMQSNIAYFSSLNDSFYRYVSGKVFPTIISNSVLSDVFLQKSNYYQLLAENDDFTEKEESLIQIFVSFWKYFSDQPYGTMLVNTAVARLKPFNEWVREDFDTKTDFLSYAKDINRYRSLSTVLDDSAKNSRLILEYPYNNGTKEKFLYGFSIEYYINYWRSLEAPVLMAVENDVVTNEVIIETNQLLDALHEFDIYLQKVLKSIPKALDVYNYALLAQIVAVMNRPGCLSNSLFLDSSFLEGVMFVPIHVVTTNDLTEIKDINKCALSLGDLRAALNIILRDLILVLEKVEEVSNGTSSLEIFIINEWKVTITHSDQLNFELLEEEPKLKHPELKTQQQKLLIRFLRSSNHELSINDLKHLIRGTSSEKARAVKGLISATNGAFKRVKSKNVIKGQKVSGSSVDDGTRIYKLLARKVKPSVSA